MIQNESGGVGEITRSINTHRGNPTSANQLYRIQSETQEITSNQSDPIYEWWRVKFFQLF